MAERIILASGSPFRRELLERAGVTFEVVRPEIDERAVEATLDGTGATPEELALVLAEAKALDVAVAFRMRSSSVRTRRSRSTTASSTSHATWRRRGARCWRSPDGPIT